MNRPIEYRIWDKKTNRFEDPEFFNQLNNIFVCDEDLVFQQFTGLVDVNGKKIFEGDIVEWRNRFDECAKGSVNYTAPSFEAYDLIRGESIPMDGRSKVIGNIFENPELLK